MEPSGAVTSRANPAYLPTDIIVQLFYALADVYPSRAPWRVRSSRGDLRGGTPGSLGWIVMTHVCQRWRGVGLDLSVLWADIVCAFPSAIKDIAQRTKTTPLTLDLSWMREPDDQLDAMDRLDLISRARTLEIAEFSGLTLDSGNDSSRFLLNRTFSHLQSLSIILDNFTDHIAKRLNPVTATGLRSLTTNVPLAIVAPSLTSLRAEGAIWHYKLLLEYIRQYPLLADLYIDTIYGDSFDDVDISPRSLETSIQMGNRIAQASAVCLSHLRSLSFMTAGLQAIRLLQYLETPNCTKFEIEEIRDDSALADLLAQSNECRGPCNTLTIYDMCNDEYGVNIVFTEVETYLNRQPTFTRGNVEVGDAVVFLEGSDW
ncbi:hypothetical protein PENSPDRAFT_733544 [Peniophora sp. CONT]|nr:hypothetical protein PENSPDRAFT_733544 [Peniophora sp. CONT]